MGVVTTAGERSDTGVLAPFGVRDVLTYACAALVIELVAFVTTPLVAVVGYAVLVILLATDVVQTIVQSEVDVPPYAGAFIVLAIPLVLRLGTLTMEKGPVVLVRHYAVIGSVAAAAAICALLAFPVVRPALKPRRGSVRRHVGAALVGIPLGLALAVLYSRSSLAPLHGRWQSTVPLLALLVGAALVEEVLFRGILRDPLKMLFGRWAPLMAAAALMLVYLNVRPAGVVFIAVALGLLSGIAVEWSGSLHGALVGRIALLVGLIYVWPRILHLG